MGDYDKKIDLFKKFLVEIQQKPKKIVFIDDKRKNLEEFEAIATQEIDFTGVHYTAIKHVKPVYDRKLAQFQNKFLDQILSNEAASMLMERGLE